MTVLQLIEGYADVAEAAGDVTPVLGMESVLTRFDAEGPGLDNVTLKIAPAEIVRRRRRRRRRG